MIGVLRRSQSLRCVTHKALERSSNTAHLWSVFETLSQREFDVRMRFLTSYNMPLLERSGG